MKKKSNTMRFAVIAVIAIFIISTLFLGIVSLLATDQTPPNPYDAVVNVQDTSTSSTMSGVTESLTGVEENIVITGAIVTSGERIAQ